MNKSSSSIYLQILSTWLCQALIDAEGFGTVTSDNIEKKFQTATSH